MPPAKLSVTISDLLRAVEALCEEGGYQSEVDDPDHAGQKKANPKSKIQFAKEVLAAALLEQIKTAEARAEGRKLREVLAAKGKMEVTIE